MTDPTQSAVPADDPKPQPPREPERDECCQSGCVPCIYDIYWEAFARYEQSLREWEARRSHTGS